MRTRVTQRLIEAKGFDIVAAEADWPDATRIDHYGRRREVPPSEWTAFARFPTWMWRNEETRGFVEWPHARNSSLDYGPRTAVYGLDLYSLYTSVRAVTDYPESVDPDLAAIARQRYGCLSPWERRHPILLFVFRSDASPGFVFNQWTAWRRSGGQAAPTHLIAVSASTRNGGLIGHVQIRNAGSQVKEEHSS